MKEFVSVVRANEISNMELDYQKIKQCYPSQVADIQFMVEDMCDRMEYEGSPMFAEVVDKTTVHQCARDIYYQIYNDSDDSDDSDEMIPCIAWPQSRHERWPQKDCRAGGCEPPYVPVCDRGNCMLRQMIEIMLLNEMSHRRNRYRARRW